MVLWGLLLAAVWPTTSYVLVGWDCANPTHVTAYNKEQMCSKEPLHQEVPLGHEVHVLQSRFGRPRDIAVNSQCPSGHLGVESGAT